jgi:hypothetical protein
MYSLKNGMESMQAGRRSTSSYFLLSHPLLLDALPPSDVSYLVTGVGTWKNGVFFNFIMRGLGFSPFLHRYTFLLS